MFLLDNAVSGLFGGNNAMGSIAMYGLLALMFVAMYFFILRPQRKKQKEEEQMRNSIEVGDDVTTIGGIVGRVLAVRDDDDTIVIETGNDKTRLRFKKWAISSVDTPDKQPKKEEKADKKEDKKDDKKKKDE